AASATPVPPIAPASERPLPAARAGVPPSCEWCNSGGCPGPSPAQPCKRRSTLLAERQAQRAGSPWHAVLSSWRAESSREAGSIALLSLAVLLFTRVSHLSEGHLLSPHSRLSWSAGDVSSG